MRGSRLDRSTAALLAALQLVAALGPLADPRAAHAAAPAVDTARAQYERAEYDQSIGSLDAAIRANALTGEDVAEAHVLLGRCYVKKSMPEVAKAHFKQGLELNPDLTLDPRLVPGDEYAVWEAVRKQAPVQTPAASNAAASAPPPHSSKKWWYIGGGAVVAGVITAVALGNKSSSTGKPPLPAYPPHPE